MELAYSKGWILPISEAAGVSGLNKVTKIQFPGDKMVGATRPCFSSSSTAVKALAPKARHSSLS